MHPRQAIRNAVKEQLRGKTAAADRIFANRRTPWWTTELPAIAVYLITENARELEEAPRRLEKIAKLQVDIVVEPAPEDDLEERLDGISREVELALGRNETLSGTATDCLYTDADFDIDESGDKPLAYAKLFFDVKYLDELAQEDPVDDLKKLSFGIQDSGSGAEIDGEINFPVP